MCGLAINITSFAHLLKRVDFDPVVDHLAFTRIMRSKVEPATTRIKKITRSVEFLFIQPILHQGKRHDFEKLSVMTKSR